MQAVGRTWPPSCRSWLAEDSSNATCRPASGTRTWMPSGLRLGNCTLASRGRKSLLCRVCKQRNLRLQRTRRRQPFLLPFPGFQVRQRATWRWGPRVLVQLALLMTNGHHFVQQLVGATPVAGGGAKVQAWAYRSCLSNSPSSSAHRSSSTFQMRSLLHSNPASISVTWNRTFLCLLPSSRHASRAVDKHGFLMARPKMPTYMDGILFDEAMERVLESIDGGEDRSRVESA